MRHLGLLIAVLGLVTACDEDNPARHLDGGVKDAPEQMSDAPVVPKPVTVTVKSASIGQEGVVVHFQNADSTLVATEMTDATGVASHLLDAGGYVTVINPFPAAPAGLPQGPSYDIRTFAGVKPGDALRVEEPAPSIETSPTIMSITLPPQTDANIYGYDVISSCGDAPIGSSGSNGSNPTGTISFGACATADIVVIATDEAGQPYKFFFVANQAITADGALDYSNKQFADASTRTYTFGDLPNTLQNLNLEQYIGTARGELLQYNTPTTGTAPATASLTFPAIPNAASIIRLNGNTSLMQHIGLEWGALATTAYSTNFAAHMLPEISGYSFDSATHAISWTAAGGAAPDFVSVHLSGTRNTSTDYRRVEWSLVAPYTAGSAKIPTLPAGTFDLNFTPNDGVSVTNILLGAIPGRGYDAVRAGFFTINNLAYDPHFLAVGASGTAQLAFTSTPTFARVKPVAPTKKTLLQHRTQSTH